MAVEDIEKCLLSHELLCRNCIIEHLQFGFCLKDLFSAVRSFLLKIWFVEKFVSQVQGENHKLYSHVFCPITAYTICLSPTVIGNLAHLLGRGGKFSCG